MGEGTNASRAGVLIALALLLMMTSAVSMANAQNPEGAEGPGINWALPDSHMLYLKGTEEQPFLDRNWTTNTGQPLGKAEFTKTSSALNPNLIDIQSLRWQSRSGSRATSQCGCSHLWTRPTMAADSPTYCPELRAPRLHFP